MKEQLINEQFNIIRKNITKYRKQKNLTQEKLAELIDCCTDYMAEIESKTKNKRFSLAILIKISISLNVPIEKFFIK